MENVVCESRHSKTTLANPIAEEEVQDAWALLTLSQVSGNGSNRAHLCSAFEFGCSTEHPYLPALVMIISVPISWNLFQRSAHCNSTWISSMVDMAAGTGPVAPDARSVWVLKEQEVRSVSTSESDPVLCSESATWTIKAKVRNYPVALMPGCKKKGGGVGRHGGLGRGVNKRRLEAGKLQSPALMEFYYLFYGLFLWFTTFLRVSCFQRDIWHFSKF